MTVELNRNQLAIIKRTAKNTKSLRDKRDKLVKKIAEASSELEGIQEAIDEFEAPIRTLTGGKTSEEVLSALNGGESQDEVNEPFIPVDSLSHKEQEELLDDEPLHP